MPNTMPNAAMPGNQFSLRKSAPLIFVIALHILIIYGIAAGLGYVKVPFEQPTISMVNVPAAPEEKIKADPIKLDASLLQQQVVEKQNVPVIIEEEQTEQTSTETMPVVVQTVESGPSIQVASAGVRLLAHPEPAYPPVSRQQNEEGTAMIRVTITAQGRVADAVLATSSGFPRLDEAALKAIRTWRFTPSMQGATPIDSAVIVPVKFKLSMHG